MQHICIAKTSIDQDYTRHASNRPSQIDFYVKGKI